MKILCIDPGITGGICKLDTITQEIQCYPMPIITNGKKKIVNVRALLVILGDEKYDILGIEEVHSMPKQGVSSSFTFGFTAGTIYAVLQMYFALAKHQLLFEYFTPQSWKKFARLINSPKEEILTKITGPTLDEINKIKTKVHRIACAEAYFMCKYMEAKHGGKL